MQMKNLRALFLVVPLLGACADDSYEEEDFDFRCLKGGGVGLIGLDAASVAGNPSITGAYPSVFSNKTVSLAGSYSIAGKAISGGTVSNSGNSMPVGGIVENAGTVSFKDPAAEVANAANANDNAKIPCVGSGNKCKSPVSNGVLSLSGQSSLTLPAGSYYLTGISMSGQTKLNVSGAVTIYLAGGATFNGGSAANPASDSLTIVSSSAQEVKINGGGTTAMNIFAPKATVRFAGSNGFRGSAIGKELHISGNASLEITQDLAVTGARTTCTPVPDPTPMTTSSSTSSSSTSSSSTSSSSTSSSSTSTTSSPDSDPFPDHPIPDLGQ